MFRLKILKCFILTLISFVVISAQENKKPDESQKIEEVHQISQRLTTVQKQALTDADIVKKTNKFIEKVETEMLKQNPSLKQKLDQRDKIINNFQEAEKQGNEERMMESQKEFFDITEELSGDQMKAMENEKLKKESQELEEAVLEKMKQIDPEIPNLIARLETLKIELKNSQNKEKL